VAFFLFCIEKEKGSNHSLSSLGSFAGICLEKILPVHVTSENILPAVPTAHDVINRSRIFHSQLARHAGKTTSSMPIPSRLWFDPFFHCLLNRLDLRFLGLLI
jgi:hypothetical protein